MFLGKREHFGIECAIQDCRARPIIGDFWLWAHGRRIGDETGGVDIPLILDHLAGPLRFQAGRHHPFFDRLSKEQIAKFFLKLIFTEERDTDEMAETGHILYRYLVISAFNLEGFDSVFVLVLGRSDGTDRLIWMHKGIETVHETLLGPGEYNSCVLASYDWVEEQTGYRAPQRSWLGLQESQRDDIRRAVVVHRPYLGEPGQRDNLDQAAIAELNRTRK